MRAFITNLTAISHLGMTDYHSFLLFYDSNTSNYEAIGFCNKLINNEIVASGVVFASLVIVNGNYEISTRNFHLHNLLGSALPHNMLQVGNLYSWE